MIICEIENTVQLTKTIKWSVPKMFCFSLWRLPKIFITVFEQKYLAHFYLLPTICCFFVVSCPDCMHASKVLSFYCFWCTDFRTPIMARICKIKNNPSQKCCVLTKWLLPTIFITVWRIFIAVFSSFHAQIVWMHQKF